MRESYNYREISDILSTSGSVNAEELFNLSNNGYEVVINLLPGSNEYAVPNEADIVQNQGVIYHHIPVDFEAPKDQDYEKFVSVMENTASLKTHIHCAANWRVSAFYSVYACQNGIWDVSRALDHINSLWSPNDYPVWAEFLANHGINV